MSKSSTNKCLGSFLSAVSLSVLVTACAADSPYANRTAISPSAQRDEPNLKGHAATPNSNIKLCFLTITGKNKPKSFATQSGKDGRYSIALPDGNYIIRSDYLGECKTLGAGYHIKDSIVNFFGRNRLATS